MKNNGPLLCALALFLGAMYFAFVRGCREEGLQIQTLARPHRRGATAERGTTPVYPVVFQLNRKYKLSSVKVVSASDLKTNKTPYALWHLVAASNAPAVKAIGYGQEIRGLAPRIAGAVADPLEAETEYVVFVEAGSVKGQTNFIARENTRIPTASQ